MDYYTYVVLSCLRTQSRTGEDAVDGAQLLMTRRCGRPPHPQVKFRPPPPPSEPSETLEQNTGWHEAVVEQFSCLFGCLHPTVVPFNVSIARSLRYRVRKLGCCFKFTVYLLRRSSSFTTVVLMLYINSIVYIKRTYMNIIPVMKMVCAIHTLRAHSHVVQ